jgi:hypothetical protein
VINPQVRTLVKQIADGGYNVEFTFLGHTWHLKTSQFTKGPHWMLRREAEYVWRPLKNFQLGYPMTLATDHVAEALTQAKFQILRLKYHKPTPTFHEQYSRNFPSS